MVVQQRVLNDGQWVVRSMYLARDLAARWRSIFTPVPPAAAFARAAWLVTR